MQTPKPHKMSKRQALLALLAAVPCLAQGQRSTETTTASLNLTPGDYPLTLLELRLNVKEGLDVETLFVRIVVNNKEEVRVSLKEALEILKG